MEEFELEMLETYPNVNELDEFKDYVRKVVQLPLSKYPKKLYFIHSFRKLDVVSPDSWPGKEVRIEILVEPYENYISPPKPEFGEVHHMLYGARRHQWSVSIIIEFDYEELDSITPLKVMNKIKAHLKHNIKVLSDDPTFEVLYGKK